MYSLYVCLVIIYKVSFIMYVIYILYICIYATYHISEVCILMNQKHQLFKTRFMHTWQ